MEQLIPEETAAAFGAIADIVYSGSTADAALERLCRIAVQAIPGADHACISTMVRPGTLRTRAASDDVARELDRLESEVGEGPCLESIVAESFQHDTDIASHSRWPRLAELALARTPVRGMIGYRLISDRSDRSAFNVFADVPGALTTESAEIGAVLSAFASVALTAIERREDADNLRKGLESNREIGKAVGILMATHSIDDEQAFGILRSASNRTNTRLVQVAEQITASQP